MKKIYILLIVIILAAAGSSLILIPRENEVALMQLKDKKFHEARATYEERLNTGDMSVDVVMPLMRLYLHYGELDNALALMEKFVTLNPDNIGARRQLGTLYQHAQRPDDYLRNLEEIRSLGKASIEELQDLADLYGFNVNYAKQIEVLQEMQKRDADNPAYATDLAWLLTGEKRFQEAVEVMMELHEQQPDAMNFDATELLVSLLMDTSKYNDAFTISADWLQRHKFNADEAARLTNLLRAKGQPQLAWSLIEPYLDQSERSASFLTEVLEIRLQRGEENAVYTELRKMNEAGKLPPPAREIYLDLAFRRNDLKTVTSLIEKSDLKLLTEARLLQLVDMAVGLQNQNLLNTIFTQLDGPFLQQRPTLDAAIGLADRGRDAAYKVRYVMSHVPMTTAQTLLLAKACARAGINDLTARLMTSLSPYTQLNDSELLDLAQLFISTHQANEGYQMFDKLRETRATPHVIEAWIRLAAQTGRTEIVAAWLRDTPDTVISDETLEDIYYIATKQKLYDLALADAERLMKRDDTARHKVMLAGALSRTGEAERALEILEPLLPGDQETEDTYLEVLYRAAKVKPEYRDKLYSVLEEKLKKPDISVGRKQELVYSLMEYAGPKDALPYVKELAKSLGGTWTESYEELLRKSNNKQELVNFYREQIVSSTSTNEQKKRAAYGLLDIDKASAADAFLKLAEYSGPKSDEVNQLIYIWGPRPPENALDWIERRARTATTADRAGWFDHLLYAGAPERIVKIMKSPSSGTENPAEAVDKYIQALLRLRDRQGLTDALTWEIDHDNNPKRLEHLSYIAFSENLFDTALHGYHKLIEVEPDNPKGLKYMGVLSYTSGAYSAAETYFKKYEALNLSDAESDFYQGELLFRKQQRDTAKPYYQSVLKRVDALPHPGYQMLALKAQSLNKLGKRDEAIAIYRTLVKRRPNDASLVADFATLLIENRDFKEAKLLMSKTEETTTNPEEVQ